MTENIEFSRSERLKHKKTSSFHYLLGLDVYQGKIVHSVGISEFKRVLVFILKILEKYNKMLFI